MEQKTGKKNSKRYVITKFNFHSKNIENVYSCVAHYIYTFTETNGKNLTKRCTRQELWHPWDLMYSLEHRMELYIDSVSRQNVLVTIVIQCYRRRALFNISGHPIPYNNILSQCCQNIYVYRHRELWGIVPKFRITQPQNSHNITYNRVNPNNIELYYHRIIYKRQHRICVERETRNKNNTIVTFSIGAIILVSSYHPHDEFQFIFFAFFFFKMSSWKKPGMEGSVYKPQKWQQSRCKWNNNKKRNIKKGMITLNGSGDESRWYCWCVFFSSVVCIHGVVYIYSVKTCCVMAIFFSFWKFHFFLDLLTELNLTLLFIEVCCSNILIIKRGEIENESSTPTVLVYRSLHINMLIWLAIRNLCMHWELELFLW